MSHYKFWCRLMPMTTNIDPFTIRGNWISCRNGEDLKREIKLHLSECFNNCIIEFLNVTFFQFVMGLLEYYTLRSLLNKCKGDGKLINPIYPK